MRKSSSSYPLLSLAGLLLAGSCSIIAEVDRTKIPTDGGPPPEGGQSSGGTSNTGGSGGKGGTPSTGGTRATGGAGGASGAGGEGGGDTGGTGGDGGGGTGGDAGGGTGGDAGAGGEGGSGGVVCGDGIIDSSEECDDGQPAANNDGCSTTCTVEPGWECNNTPSDCTAAMCGDRIEAGAEVCDDGNGNACGTCNANCSTQKTPAKASGAINPGGAANLVDGETFTLNDGVNAAVVFEFDEAPGDGVAGTNIAVPFTAADTATELQTAIVTAINGVTTALAIAASNGTAPVVNLLNDANGAHGNTTIGDTVADAGFTVTNFTGGVAKDCTTGTGCVSDNDCVTTCNSTSHQCN
jgi:cysteine-rich repeat protein